MENGIDAELLGGRSGMSDSKIIVNLDFNSSRGHFLRELQHQLDVVTLLLAGARRVTAEEAEPQELHNFSPAHGAELSHEEARKKALEWLSTSLLRDAIEATDQFLSRCLSFCAAIELAGKKQVNGEALNHLLGVVPNKHHKLHFPAKIEKLERQYGVKPRYAEQVLSLNRLRTCVVHRRGLVTAADVSDGDRLVAKWVTSRFVLRGLETGEQLVLTEPGQGLNEQAQLEMQIVGHEKAFEIGESILLESYDTFSTIFTLWRFGLACNDVVKEFAVRSGVPVRTE